MEMTVQESQLDAQMEAETTPEVVKNLATIQKISSLSPIEGADKIELAKMEGLEWQVVVQKGLHQVGSLVCYIQIDSICPEKPWAEFLRDRHFRVRTIRLKKQLSQGLIIPLKDLSLDAPGSNPIIGYVGRDITQEIGVTKYEKEIPSDLNGKVKGNFPRNLVSITDETNLQNCSRILEELIDVPVYISVKMDGSSATYIYNLPENLAEGETHVCSRKWSLTPPAEGETSNTFFEMEQKYNILEKIKSKGSFAVQGELCGPKINKNKMGLLEPDLFVFNVYDIKAHKYLDFPEFLKFCNDLGFKTVPIIEYATLLNGKKFDELLAMADGLYPNNTPREGIVVRPTQERYSEYMRGRVSFKIVSNVFLLHHKE